MWAFRSTEEGRISAVGRPLRPPWPDMAMQKVILGGAAASLLVVSALSMIPPWLAKYVIDDVINRPLGAHTILFQIAAALMIIHSARALLTYANRYAIAWAGQKVVLAI